MLFRSLMKSEDGLPDLEEGESSNSIYVDIEVAAPGSDNYVQLLAILDTGCECALAIPSKLAKELGLDLTVVGNEPISTAGGSAVAKVAVADVKVSTINGGSVPFFGIEVSLGEKLNEPLLGMGLLKFFSVHLENGRPVVFELNDITTK